MTLSIIEMMLNAGLMVKMVMLTLLVFSLVSWSIIIMKYFMFRKSQQASDAFLGEFWNSKTLNEAYNSAQVYAQSPEAAVFITGYGELKKSVLRALPERVGQPWKCSWLPWKTSSVR